MVGMSLSSSYDTKKYSMSIYALQKETQNQTIKSRSDATGHKPYRYLLSIP